MVKVVISWRALSFLQLVWFILLLADLHVFVGMSLKDQIDFGCFCVKIVSLRPSSRSQTNVFHMHAFGIKNRNHCLY